MSWRAVWGPPHGAWINGNQKTSDKNNKRFHRVAMFYFTSWIMGFLSIAGHASQRWRLQRVLRNHQGKPRERPHRGPHRRPHRRPRLLRKLRQRPKRMANVHLRPRQVAPWKKPSRWRVTEDVTCGLEVLTVFDFARSFLDLKVLWL